MGLSAGPTPPPIDELNYDNAGLLETVIREAARRYGFVVERVAIHVAESQQPRIVFDLRQVIRREP